MARADNPLNDPGRRSAQTQMVHGGTERTQFGETSEALYLNSGFVYASSGSAEARFKNEEPGYIYSRFSNPSVDVDAYLARHPGAARRVEDYRAINRALRLAFEPVLDEPIPAAHVGLALHRRPRVAAPMAAALIGLLIGGAAVWLAQDYLFRDRLVTAELANRTKAAYGVYAPETRHPVEVFAQDSGHLAAWLSNRMGMAFRIPPLGDLGFVLVGGRLMVGDNAPAALLMYENEQGRRLVLYVRNDLPSTRRMAMRYERSAGTGVLTWTDGARGFGLSGGFSELELLPVAEVVRTQYAS